MHSRPRIVLAMASSIDGKVTTRERPKLRYGSDEDRRRLEERRVAADAVLIGKGQLLGDDPPLLVRSPERRERRRREKGADHPLNCIVSTRLDFDLESLEFFNHPETRRLLFTTPLAGAAQLDIASRLAQVEVVPAGPDGRVDLSRMTARMAELGLGLVTLEGGGALNFAMLAAGLVDEIHLTLCPFVFGGKDVPTTVNGEGFVKEAVRCLELAACETSPSGEVFLHYRVPAREPVLEPAANFSKAFRLR